MRLIHQTLGSLLLGVAGRQVKIVKQYGRKVVAGIFFKIRDNARFLSPFHRRKEQLLESIIYVPAEAPLTAPISKASSEAMWKLAARSGPRWSPLPARREGKERRSSSRMDLRVSNW
jgi:hypothetical protein